MLQQHAESSQPAAVVHATFFCFVLSRYKVFAVELDVLKPPVDELELVRTFLFSQRQRHGRFYYRTAQIDLWWSTHSSSYASRGGFSTNATYCQIGLGISPIKQRPHNVPQKQLDLRRSALKNERSGSAQKRQDGVPKQLFATHRENQG